MKYTLKYTLDLTHMDDLTEFLRKINNLNEDVIAYVGNSTIDAKRFETMNEPTRDYPITIGMMSDDAIKLIQFRQICEPFEVHEGACDC